MKKLLSMMAIAAMVTSFWGCGGDDDETPNGPSIAAPTVTNVQVETSANVSFDVTVPGGYKSGSVTATGGTASITTQPTAGAKSGTVVASFVANATAGAGSVILTVTDNNNKTTVQTGVVNKTTLPVTEVVVVSGVIEEDQLWESEKIYELAGRVIVGNEATLTIEAGTIIKGRTGTGINASALMVARGGKLNAMGTSTNPIIMTSVSDNIMPGETISPNLDETDRGLWGGLVILGKAPISVSGATEAQIEGVPASEPLGLYGGDVADDNSGTITFVSIRHGGTVLSGGNEINGLTLGGVGSETTISDIEIFANIDDGVEFFGGSVNVSNILVVYQGDDGVDIDQAYSGTVDGFLVIHGGDTDEGLEIDGPEGAANATGKFTLKNGTLKGDPTQTADVSSPADFKSKAQGTVENVVWTGYTAGKKIQIASSYDGSCVPTSDAYKNLVDGNLVFTTVQFTGYTVDVYTSGACDTSGNDATAAGLITSETATGAPDASTTWGWTNAAALSLLD